LEQHESKALLKLRGEVENALREIGRDSQWRPSLEVLATELGEGQPFFFKIASASESRSMSDASVLAP
jgi:hypothetical protein